MRKAKPQRGRGPKHPKQAGGRGAARPTRGGRPERGGARFEQGEQPERERPMRGIIEERERLEKVSANEQVEGRHPVMEALKAKRTINKILVAEGAIGGSMNDILHAAREANIIVQSVPKAKLDQISEGRNHQGVIAYIAAKDYVELDEIIEAANKSPRPGLIVVLDEVEDPHNLGSILRSADAAGAHGVVIPKRRAVPLTAIVAKASAGAIEHVPVARVTNISQALQELKKAGFWVVGTDVEGKSMYTQVDMTGPIVLVTGNEGKGLGDAVKKHCDYLTRLPMIGEVQSLNAGVATGIMLYETVRQRGEKRS
ncbi:MAG TPA: 23S rRNA (guanosine(2251)-2'-O)-methyltransferase RlmB [Bacilli bacterium]|nr:23S rRNA (guanosine(2251)-2'-O)-methyltransferase RlmB [Bacilli bacterium]